MANKQELADHLLTTRGGGSVSDNPQKSAYHREYMRGYRARAKAKEAAPLNAAAAERFWSKAQVLGASDCWPWLGWTLSERWNYGRVTLSGKNRVAAQVAWEILKASPFPKGKIACHECDNPICVNPAHIWPGTYRDNARDCVEKGRHGKAHLTHCKRGHALTEDNRRPDPRGGSRCRACARVIQSVAYKRERAAIRSTNQGGSDA